MCQNGDPELKVLLAANLGPIQFNFLQQPAVIYWLMQPRTVRLT